MKTISSSGKRPLKTVRATGETVVIKDTSLYQDNLLALVVAYPSLRELLDSTDEAMFSSPERKRVAGYLRANKAANLAASTPVDLQEDDTYVKILLLKADTRYESWSDKDRYFEAGRLIRQLVTEHKKHQKLQSTADLRNAELAGDDETARQIRESLNKLIKEIASGEK